MTAVERSSVLRCPACGHADTLVMPTDACLFFHECAGCHTLLRPRPGDCCVFCSFGSVPCPPIQAGGGTCGGGSVAGGGDARSAAECRGATRPPADAPRAAAASTDA